MSERHVHQAAGLILARRARSGLDHRESADAEPHGFGEQPAGPVRLGAFDTHDHGGDPRQLAPTRGRPRRIRVVLDTPRQDVNP